MLDSFVKRFIAATSYSAYSLIVAKLPNHLLQGLTPIAVAGVVYCQKLQGVQNVFAMLAAQGITDSLTIPYEPTGYLVLPAAMFYFSVIATIAWGVHCVIAHTGAADNAASAILDEYVCLFCTAKVVAAFVAANQEHVLGVISFAYLVLPTSSIIIISSSNSSINADQDNAISKDEGDQQQPAVVSAIGSGTAETTTGCEDWSAWLTQFIGMVDGLAARGAMMWLGGLLTQWTAYGNGLFFLYLVVLMTPVFDLTPKLMQCHSVLSLLCSRQAVAMLSVYKSTWVSVSVFASCFALLQAAPSNSISKHICTLSDTCFFGASIVLTNALSIWIDGCGPAETACCYISVYVLLEALRRLGDTNNYSEKKKKQLATAAAAAAAPSKNKKASIMANNLPLLPMEDIFWS